MAQKKIQNPEAPDTQVDERFLPSGSKKLADALIRHTEIELTRLRQSVRVLLELEDEMATNDVWKFDNNQKYNNFKRFFRSRFGMNADEFFRLLRELRGKFPYDPFEE